MTSPLPPRILVVEDEPKLARLISDYLQAEHYTVAVLHDGSDVAGRVREDAPDLLLLDIMLPGKDGLSLCREIRAFSSVPIILVTARGEEIDRLLGLELGADDYICKPFSPREMVARVKAILRRTRETLPPGETNADAPFAAASPAPAPGPAPGPGLHMDPEAHLAWLDGTKLDLTPAEFRLLLLLSGHPGRAFTREQILDALYDDNRIVTDRTIDTHVKNLRRKLEQAGGRGGGISSVYGVGYRYEGP